MERYYVIVMSIALVLLILTLTYIGIFASYSDINTTFPPIQNQCPDYWESTEDGLCKVPAEGTQNSGIKDPTSKEYNDTYGLDKTNAPNTIDFNHPDWNTTGKTKICALKDWSNNNGLVWDGVSNYNKC